MKIIIRAKELELTTAINDYINEKIGFLGRFLKRFETKQDIKAEIEIARATEHHRHGRVFYAEANLYLPGKTLRAEYSDLEIRAAIDEIQGMLKQEIKKYKEIKSGTTRKKDAERRGKL